MSILRSRNGGGHCTDCGNHWFPFEGFARGHRCGEAATGRAGRRSRAELTAAPLVERKTLDRAAALEAGIQDDVYEPSWRDSSHDSWGAREQRQLVARAWGGGNCVAACVGSLLGADIATVPDPTEVEYQQHGDWLTPYNERLSKALNHRLEELPKSLCPPRDPTQLWIAGLRDEPANHVVVARGHFVVFDPARLYQGLLPAGRLLQGFVLKPTRRLIPNLSPLGSGYSIVAA